MHGSKIHKVFDSHIDEATATFEKSLKAKKLSDLLEDKTCIIIIDMGAFALAETVFCRNNIGKRKK